MDCGYTGSDQTESMTLTEAIDFLEPSNTKGPALCLSSEDYEKNSTAMDQACKKLGPWCSYEVRSEVAKSKKRISKVRDSAAAKLKKEK